MKNVSHIKFAHVSLNCTKKLSLAWENYDSLVNYSKDI